MAGYQYGTSPRKLEPEYMPRRKKVEQPQKKISRVEQIKIDKEKATAQRKKQAKQIFIVLAVFAMLLTISYETISTMEKFNEKKKLENKLATIQKENGQIEKEIKQVESTMDWNYIKQIATEQLGMQIKPGSNIDLQKEDNVEVNKEAKIENTNESLLEKIIKLFIK